MVSNQVLLMTFTILWRECIHLRCWLWPSWLCYPSPALSSDFSKPLCSHSGHRSRSGDNIVFFLCVLKGLPLCVFRRKMKKQVFVLFFIKCWIWRHCLYLCHHYLHVYVIFIFMILCWIWPHCRTRGCCQLPRCLPFSGVSRTVRSNHYSWPGVFLMVIVCHLCGYLLFGPSWVPPYPHQWKQSQKCSPLHFQCLHKGP